MRTLIGAPLRRRADRCEQNRKCRDRAQCGHRDMPSPKSQAIPWAPPATSRVSNIRRSRQSSFRMLPPQAAAEMEAGKGLLPYLPNRVPAAGRCLDSTKYVRISNGAKDVGCQRPVLSERACPRLSVRPKEWAVSQKASLLSRPCQKGGC